MQPGFLIISLLSLFLLPLFRPIFVLAEVDGAEKSSLEQQLWAIQQEIEAYEKQLSQTTTQKKTLINKVEELKRKRTKLELESRATKLQLDQTGRQISYAEEEIIEIQKNIEIYQKQMAEIIRAIRRADLMSTAKILLSAPSLTDFFLDLEEVLKLKSDLDNILKQKQNLLDFLNLRKEQLEGKKYDYKELLNIQLLEQEEVLNIKQEQENLLQKTKNKESEYQKIVSDAEKRAAEIRNRLYEMAAVKAITFGEAVKLADWVKTMINIRPAFLLSVITQESNLGKNVGTCNRPGDPPEKSWRQIMKPERDQEPFLAITKELGLDPDTQPVSCPMKDKNGNQIGWGGAMGPAQFIPSTWQGYKKRLTAYTGRAIANPWDIRDAFLAASLLLYNNGARAGNEDSEWRAAMIYFSGSTNQKYRFYGDSVLERAKQYEQDIKDLSRTFP